MVLAQWHIALANSLGDPVVYRPTAGSSKDDQLQGNVRYSAANRESYLQRAMAKIQSDALIAVAERSRSFQTRTLQAWFPTSTVSVVESAEDNETMTFLNFFRLPDALYLYSVAMRFPSFSAPLQGHLMGAIPPLVPGLSQNLVTGQFGHFTGGVAVPILATDEAYRRTTTRGISDQSPYCYMVNGGLLNNNDPTVYVVAQKYYEYLYAYMSSTPDSQYWWGEDLWLVFEATYLPKAPDLSKLILEDNVAFEPMYVDAILRYASLYGQLDSQEVGGADNAVQLLYKPHFALQPEMPGGQYGNI